MDIHWSARVLMPSSKNSGHCLAGMVLPVQPFLYWCCFDLNVENAFVSTNARCRFELNVEKAFVSTKKRENCRILSFDVFNPFSFRRNVLNFCRLD